jgi:hypothetical protein
VPNYGQFDFHKSSEKNLKNTVFKSTVFFLDVYLGDNCIVMKILPASIGDLMVTN